MTGHRDCLAASSRPSPEEKAHQSMYIVGTKLMSGKAEMLSSGDYRLIIDIGLAYKVHNINEIASVFHAISAYVQV